jgi:hypothetical protein
MSLFNNISRSTDCTGTPGAVLEDPGNSGLSAFAQSFNCSAIPDIPLLPMPPSPPSYPSPWMNPSAVGWEQAYEQAKDFVSQLTLLEKVNLTTGIG